MIGRQWRARTIAWQPETLEAGPQRAKDLQLFGDDVMVRQRPIGPGLEPPEKSNFE